MNHNRVYGGDYGHDMVAWRNPQGLGSLGDDTQTLLDYGFNSLQIQQIMAARASGALSDAGYSILESGFVAPGDLADFLAADPGAPAESGTHVALTPAVSPTISSQQLAPGPAPRVTAPAASSSISSFFTGSNLVAGIPNMVVIGIGLVALTMLTGGGRRR
jgi:hypothetical protein